MLFDLVFIFCSAFAVLGQDMVKLNPLNTLLSQVNYLPGFQTGNRQPQVIPGFTKPLSSYDHCPANKVLQKIEVILLKVLNDEYDKNLASNQAADINTLTSGGEKLVVPLSKINSLRDLLEKNSLQKKLRTKVTVKYELPSIEDLNCKQALTQILQVLREAKLMHEYYRTCSPKDKCPSDNVVDIKSSGDNNVLNTAINQGNNYGPSKFANLETGQNSAKLNDGTESDKDLNSLMKYLLSNKSKEIMSLLKNYRTPEQLNLLNETVSKELLEKFKSNSLSDDIQNLQTNNKFTFQQIQNPTIETSNQNANISDIIAQALLDQAKEPLKGNSNFDKKQDSLVGTGANGAKIFSLFPSENGKNIEIDGPNDDKTNINVDSVVADNKVLPNNVEIQKQQSIIKNTIGSFPNDLNVNNHNVSDRNILSVLETVKPGADYNKLVSSMMQYQLNNHQFPLQQPTGSKYQGPQPYYGNGNLVMNSGKYLSPNEYPGGPVYQPPYQIGSYSSTHYTNPYRYPNLNMLNNNPQLLNNQQMLYQTSYVKTNPYLVNNVKQTGQQLYAPFNLYNPQRLSGVTDQNKLNFAADVNGIVELTYMLKQPNPVVYQPVYFVKYRLPYDSFVNNLKELLVKKPYLRTDPAKLYQELIAVSNIAEVSPSLKGVGKEKLTEMVTANGALVNTKVLKVNETLLSKQLETVQNLNSILTPSEIVNVTYSVQVNANKQAENLEKLKLPTGVTDTNEIDIKYLEDILNQNKRLGKDMDVVTTVPAYNKLVQNYVLPNIPTLR